MRLNISSILSFFVILLIPITLFAVKDHSFNLNSALAYTLTPPITPPISPTPTPVTGSYRITVSDPNEITCVKGDPNCQIYTVLQAWNRTDKPLYDTVMWVEGMGATISFIGFDGTWTTSQSKTTRVIYPGEQAINTLVKVVPPANQTGTFYAYAYLDGKTCNTYPDCAYYGGGSQFFKITVVNPSPTPTIAPTPTPTIAPTPTITPTVTPTPTPQIKTMTLNIAQGSDDAWQTADVNKTVNTNSSSIKLGWYAGVSGFRFAGNLSDLKNKTVLKANLSLTSTNNTNSPINIRIFAQNSAACSTFNTTQDNIGSRPISQNSVLWTPTNWAMNTSYNSPNLKSLINEVINRSDFEGNSLCILVQNNDSAKYSERLVRAKESSLPSAKLTITYQ